MASQTVTVQWIRPKRYEGVVEKIARSRIRGRIDQHGETRAMWRGKPYKVKVVDKGYLAQQDVITKSSPRKLVPKPARKPHKVPAASPNAGIRRSPHKVKAASPRAVAASQTTNALPSGNTRHRASRRPSLPLTSPMRAGTTTTVKAVIHPPPSITRREQPSSTSLMRSPVIEPDSSSSVLLSNAHGDATLQLNSASRGTPSRYRTPPLNKLLDPSVAKYLKDLEKRVVRLEELYKAVKPSK